MKILHSLGSGFAQIFWELVSARAKTLYNNTNSVASRNIKGEMVSLPASPKSLSLKLPMMMMMMMMRMIIQV